MNVWMTGNLLSLHQAHPAVQIALTEDESENTARKTVPIPKKTVIFASTQNVLNVRVTSRVIVQHVMKQPIQLEQRIVPAPQEAFVIVIPRTSFVYHVIPTEQHVLLVISLTILIVRYVIQQERINMDFLLQELEMFTESVSVHTPRHLQEQLVLEPLVQL